jgi:CheY-like chemotaxis protein
MDSSAKIQPTKGCVLVVDGEPVNLKLMELVLTQQNFTVSIAENEIEAISLVTKNKYDVIVLDIMMPETEDYQVLKAVKKNEASKATPVVVCSG